MKGTAGDLKMQLTMVRDHIHMIMDGGEGFNKPQVGRDRSIPEGMPAPVQARIDPKDLLDPNKRPDDIPVPKDSAHAELIVEFLDRHSKPAAPAPPTPAPETPPGPVLTKAVDSEVKSVSYDDLLA